MELHGVVPDVLDIVPNQRLEIKYGNLCVEQGTLLTPQQVINSPTLVNWGAEPEKYYTLFMVDPDAPSRSFPVFREVIHWLVVNIPGNKVGQGQVFVDYRGAGPPRWTGVHRYVFAAFEQPSEFPEFPEKKLDKTVILGRVRYSMRELVKKYNLGEPVAGNFFQSQFTPMP